MRVIRSKVCGGFTLIEIIVTLVIAGIFGSILVVYFGGALTRSATPLERLDQALSLQSVMENITADYRNNLRKDLEELQSRIDRIDDNDYGSYTVIHNHFIKFVDGSEDLDTENMTLLKVTIQNAQGEQVTTLFHRSM